MKHFAHPWLRHRFRRHQWSTHVWFHRNTKSPIASMDAKMISQVQEATSTAASSFESVSRWATEQYSVFFSRVFFLKARLARNKYDKNHSTGSLNLHCSGCSQHSAFAATLPPPSMCRVALFSYRSPAIYWVPLRQRSTISLQNSFPRGSSPLWAAHVARDSSCDLRSDYWLLT